MNAQLFRVHWKTLAPENGSFMSDAKPLSECERMAARLKRDATIYAVTIKPDYGGE